MEVGWKSVLTELVVVVAAVGGDDGDDDRQQLHHHHHHFPAVDSNVKEDGHCWKKDGGRQERWPSN